MPALSAEIPNENDGAEAFVRKTLEKPGQPTRPSEIPPLTDSQVDQLAVDYLRIRNPTEKFGLTWALAFSQNDRAFDTLRYSMQDEFAGGVLSRRDNGTQMWIVPLIGVLAHTSDRAWNYLLHLSHPDNWARIETWSEDYLTEQYKSEERSRAQIRSSLQHSVFSALGTSGRPEFIEWANSLLTTVPSEHLQTAAVSIRHGVFRARYIAENGIDRFYDEVLFDQRRGSGAFVAWAQTEEGKNWGVWRDAQFEALSARRSSPQPNQSNSKN